MEKIDSKEEDEDTKAILLNNLSSRYDNVIFTLCQLSSQSLDEMIASLLEEEKRMKEGDAKEEVSSHIELALFSKGKINKNKRSIECFY